jgi:hypothetical protein
MDCESRWTNGLTISAKAGSLSPSNSLPARRARNTTGNFFGLFSQWQARSRGRSPRQPNAGSIPAQSTINSHNRPAAFHSAGCSDNANGPKGLGRRAHKPLMKMLRGHMSASARQGLLPAHFNPPQPIFTGLNFSGNYRGRV